MGISGQHNSHIFQIFEKIHYFPNYLLIVDAFSKLPKIHGTENFNTKEVMDTLDMFQAWFVK